MVDKNLGTSWSSVFMTFNFNRSGVFKTDEILVYSVFTIVLVEMGAGLILDIWLI